jgi:hypothetical protein
MAFWQWIFMLNRRFNIKFSKQIVDKSFFVHFVMCNPVCSCLTASLSKSYILFVNNYFNLLWCFNFITIRLFLLIIHNRVYRVARLDSLTWDFQF